MNALDMIAKSKADEERRAGALAALKVLLTYKDGDGKVHTPGEADFDPAFCMVLGQREMATELDNALKTSNSDGLNAMLGRWYSANMAYQSDSAKQRVKPSISTLQHELAVLKNEIERLVRSRPISTTAELAKRLTHPRPVGAPNAGGLSRR
jgi:hypothetical protein